MRLGDYLRDLGRPVTYWPRLCPTVGGVNACILLCHLIWWGDKGDDPDGWIYKTQKDIEAETGLTRREQDTARAKLIDAGLLAVERRGVPPILHYRPDLDALETAWSRECTKAPDRMHTDADTPAPKRQILTTTKKTKEIVSTETIPLAKESDRPAPAPPMTLEYRLLAAANPRAVPPRRPNR